MPSTDLVLVGEFGPYDELSDIAHQQYVDGYAARGVAMCRRWQRLTRAAGDMTTYRFLLYTESICLQDLGRHEEAVAVARRLLGVTDQADAVWRAKALAMVAEASTRQGNHARAMGALAEADWAMHTIPPGSYGHLSASMAVALALRSVNLYENADERLRALQFAADPVVRLLVVHELAELSAAWAVSLTLVGDDAAAAGHYRRLAGRALNMQRCARAAGSPAMMARGEVFEAFALMHLGRLDLATARVRATTNRFDNRPELLETQLARLVLARAATEAGAYEGARVLLELSIRDAQSNGRDTWLATALEALADVDVAEHGRTPAAGIWKAVARGALARLWAEREGRFSALQDRDHIRRLTAETDRMGRVALQDPLTGLGNRRLLVSTLESATRPLSVVFIDVDDFKSINDLHSHAVGDEVLRRIGQILRAQCRTEDVIVRYGGDEFIILTSSDTERARTVAERVHEAIRSAGWRDVSPGLAVTVSVGVGLPDGEDESPLVAADIALLAAKRAGRDRVAGATAPPASRDADDDWDELRERGA
ncbi:GGDEF domain-containing protein [Actinotalea sp. AC32]|nr:GGDEF domain-containing protein [Actinotalea sp. AC32]